VTLRIGVDLGGTKTEAVVVRVGETPEVLARKRIPTERDRGYEHIVEAVRGLVEDVEREAADHGGASIAALSAGVAVGVGMPGSMTRAGLVKNSNTTCLNGRPFRSDLSRALGRDVTFANDANCFALAEARWGAGHGARVVFGVILGTGVGGGIVIDGAPWEGAQGIAGDWGHVVLDPHGGLACYCGKRGCVETYLSGPAIERAYRDRVGVGAAGVSAGAGPALRDIVTRAAEGERVAKELLDETLDVFGRALATVLDVLDPDVVVLGGGVSQIDAFYTEGSRAVSRWIFNDELVTPIVRHTLGDSAGVLGAALLPA
jgi:fructokinase